MSPCGSDSSRCVYHFGWCKACGRKSPEGKPLPVHTMKSDDQIDELNAKIVKLAEINIAYINQLADKDVRIETLEDLVRCRVEDETEFDTEWDTLARKALSAKDDEVKG